VAIAGGIGLSIGAFLLARQQESLRAETEFIRRADIHYAALQASLDRHLESLHSVQRLMQLTRSVTQAEFREWAHDIVAVQPEIQVIEWAPRVRNEERAAYETAARQFTVPDYSIREQDMAGRRKPKQTVINLILHLTYHGWKIIHNNVIKRFGNIKDAEYQMVID
jgi:CHASE1-domain containing sensor protein